ncbi:MAG TPA: response regulator transcription factor [Chloroflexota bacterium]|nr:response regulator transcription factor [Chloroflexota bacterium]
MSQVLEPWPEMNHTDRPAFSTPARVLVLQDLQVIAKVVKLTLNHGLYVTREAKDVAEARYLVEDWKPHLAILDMDSGGGQILRQLGGSTTSGTRVPALGMTRRGDLQAKLAAFEQGADDIVAVPFSPEELLARMLVMTRRTYGDVPLSPVIKVGELEIDILRRQVKAGPSDLHLTGLEQSLLYLLAANAPRVVSRNDILDALWGIDYVSSSNVVDQHVRNLRAKLQDNGPKPRFIATEPGQGYRFLPILTTTVLEDSAQLASVS